MIAMNLLQLKAAVAGIVGKTPADIDDRYFNNALAELASLSRRRRTASANINADGTFTLPADCLVLKAVNYNGENYKVELKPYPGNTLPQVMTGTPAYYYQVENTFYLIPKQISGSVSIYYIPRPASLVNDQDVPELEDSGPALIALAAQRWLEDNTDDDTDIARWRAIAAGRKADWLAMDMKRHYTPVKIRNVLEL